MKIVQVENLRRVCLSALDKAQVPLEEAQIVIDCLIEANLMGVDFQGVTFLPAYIDLVKKGIISPGAKIRVISESESTMVVDGGHGFGQVVGFEAMRQAIRKASKSGIGSIAVRNTNDIAMLANYPMLAIKQNFIGIAMCNAPPNVAAWGGSSPVFGTNPICFAIPADKENPVILDMATSAAAAGKIRASLQKNEKIPEGWALDEAGRPTTEPSAAMSGSLLPFGGHKGYGLAIVIEIFSGILSGMATSVDIRTYAQLTRERRANWGQLYFAIDPSKFTQIQLFKTNVDLLISHIKSSKLALGFNQILIPGEERFSTKKKRLIDGVPIDDKTWDDIVKSAE